MTKTRCGWLGYAIHTTTVGALQHHAVKDEAGLRETSHILLLRLWPALRKSGAARLVGELDRDGVLLIDLALEIDDGMGVRDLLLLGDEVGVHASLAEDFFKLYEGKLGVSFPIGEDALQSGTSQSITPQQRFSPRRTGRSEIPP